eukprot:scaffold121896_cov29-Attheya_sp.AAC.1
MNVPSDSIRNKLKTGEIYVSYCEKDDFTHELDIQHCIKSRKSRGRAQVTEYKRLQTINSNYISSSQKRDGIPRDVSHFLLIFLYIEIPVSTNQAIFDITHSQIYGSLVKCCYKVQRSELFVYGAPNLKKYNHWTLGKVGGDHFETERSAVNFISLTNDRDWDYDADEPNRPICIFTRNKMFEGTPYLDLLHDTGLTFKSIRCVCGSLPP